MLPLNAHLYNSFPYFATTNSKLIHFFQDTKPWRNSLSQNIFPSYLEYYHKQRAYTNYECEDLIYYKNIGNDIIKKNIIFDKWKNLFSNYKFISFFRLYPIFSNNRLELHYSEFIYIEIQIDLYKNNFTCGAILKNNKVESEEYLSLFENILEKIQFLHKVDIEDGIKFYVDGVEDYNLVHVINDLSLSLFLITSLSNEEKKKYQYLIYNIFFVLDKSNYKFICRNEDGDFSLCYFPVYYILYDMDKSLLYDPIEYIYLDNNDIKCELNDDGSISIKKGKYYLSAQKNGIVKLKEKKDSFEKFLPVPKKINDADRKIMMYLRTYHGGFLHLDILKSFRQENQPLCYVKYNARLASNLHNSISDLCLDNINDIDDLIISRNMHIKCNNKIIEVELIPKIM